MNETSKRYSKLLSMIFIRNCLSKASSLTSKNNQNIKKFIFLLHLFVS